MVECDLAKVEVAGSNPVSRSNCLLSIRLRASPSRNLCERNRDRCPRCSQRVENLKVVVVAYFWRGLSTVDGNVG